MKNNEEIWKNIEGYDGDYQVSDKGRVKSLKYGKEKTLKQQMIPQGYLYVVLHKNGKMKMCLIHRLVAMAFIPNPNCLPEVNHIDENKENNKVENLEFCDRNYNCNYGTRTQRQAEKKSKPVLQYSKSGDFIKEWKSLIDVERNLGYSQGNISQCCREKIKSAYNFVWRYKEEKTDK